MSIFYLKINTNNDVAVACFNHWVEIVKAFGADYYIVCDNNELEERVKNNENKSKFIISDKRAKDILVDIVRQAMLNTGVALLTPFFHALENGYNNFYNIDADDTVMCCEPMIAAKALKKAQEYADNSDINCFSLDMYSTVVEERYKQWSFGVTYTKMNMDYITAVKKYKSLMPDLAEKDLLWKNTLDGMFSNLTDLGVIKTNVFDIENMYFVHVPRTIHYCENGYFNFIKTAFHFNKHNPLNVLDKVKIPEHFVKFDTGISKVESLAFLERNKKYMHAISNQLSHENQFNLRQELAKSFELFRKNINTPIYLSADYHYFIRKAAEYSGKTGYFLLNDVEGFVDVSQSKIGSKWLGLDTYSLENIKEKPFIVISNVDNKSANILAANGYIQHYDFCFEFEIECAVKRFLYSRTRSFQNIHKGKRCFIAGGGTSLTLDDIEALKNKGEIVMVSNNFSKWFNKTDFRPDYYFFDEMSNISKECEYTAISDAYITIFADISYWSLWLRYPDNLYYFERNFCIFYSEYPYKVQFSEDIALPYAAGTISYIMLQAAVNMGFDEIYLIGMDNDFPAYINYKGEIVKSGKSENTQISTSAKDMFESAYAYTRDYCENKGVKIFNATRGGKLDIFERIDFDSLF